MAGVRIHSLHEGEINFELKKSDVLALKLCPHTLLPSPVMHEVRILAIDGDQIFASASLPVSVKHTVPNAGRRDAFVATTTSNLESVSLKQLVEVLSPTPNQRIVYGEPVEVTVKLKPSIGAAPGQVCVEAASHAGGSNGNAGPSWGLLAACRLLQRSAHSARTDWR